MAKKETKAKKSPAKKTNPALKKEAKTAPNKIEVVGCKSGNPKTGKSYFVTKAMAKILCKKGSAKTIS